MQKRIWFWLFVKIGVLVAYSQGVMRGQWRDHFSYMSAKFVEVTPDVVWAATQKALFYLDKKTEEIHKISRIQGLSETSISAIAWDATRENLMVGYVNGNIDLVKTSGIIYNIPDIKISHINGEKKINQIFIYNDFAYLATQFGIVVLNLRKNEIKETYVLSSTSAGNPVYDIQIIGDSIYAATQNGIFVANISSANLAYFGNWHKISGLPTPTSQEKFLKLARVTNKLLILFKQPSWGDDVIFRYSNGVVDTFLSIDREINSIVYSKNKILVCNGFSLEIYDSTFQFYGKIYIYQTHDGIDSLSPMPNDAEYDTNSDFLYIADELRGLVKNWGIWDDWYFTPSSPFLSTCFSINISGKMVGITGGGFNSSYNNIFSPAFWAVFADEKWKSYHSIFYHSLDTFKDPTAIYVDPFDPAHMFVGFFNQGLIEFKNGQIVQQWNASNSSLSPASGTDKVRVTSITPDKQGNLWITTCQTNNILSVLTSKKELITFNIPTSFTTTGTKRIAFDSHGNKWIPLPRNEGIIVFNENGTLLNFSDDKYMKLSTSPNQGNLPNLSVNTIAIDKNDQVWIGTGQGIAIISSSDVFSGQPINAQQILVEVGGYVQPLLASENVTSIAVDGGNRKWIGTEKSGVFLLSSDGTKEIFHFTTENSPLPSNTILDIAIHPSTGEVFIATAEGLVSYLSDASEAVEMYDSVRIYPNPVPSDFQGLVTITNLVDNSTVTITDMYGNLIYQTTSLGGTAVWNCKDIKGERPATGVYIVLIANEDGSMKTVGKFLFYH